MRWPPFLHGRHLVFLGRVGDRAISICAVSPALAAARHHRVVPSFLMLALRVR